MAWFKLNDSLNSIKGQISNVTNVVQEAFQEGISSNDTEENLDTYEEQLKEAARKIDDLTDLCSSQDNEVGGFLDIKLCTYLILILFYTITFTYRSICNKYKSNLSNRHLFDCPSVDIMTAQSVAARQKLAYFDNFLFGIWNHPYGFYSRFDTLGISYLIRASPNDHFLNLIIIIGYRKKNKIIW